ncbi:class I SAM-dependent methyltransferase [Novipirellula maiorica]|uniref:class I SAM-dependent methyltransferase n=1 Tax=Novipirellula maiorica TaxID=1265734 RepID=UPI001360B528|nr:class I SAM-dependent methyltransferase [Rhodopirellula maiorica]
MKKLIPLTARDRYRPAYQQVLKWFQRQHQTIVQSSVFPKPSAWHDAKKEFSDVIDSAQLYAIAGKEFGILQVENEIVPFLDYVAEHTPVVIGEIGLKHGGNSFMFLRKLQDVTLYLGMDLVLENISKLKFYRRDQQQMYILEGNSQLPAIVNKARQHLAGRQFDFLFIDGDHEYAGVLEDLIQWYPLVKPGGLIALHDIVPDEEAKTGVRPAGRLWGGGVYKLWANIKPHFEHKEFVNDWDQGGFGIGVITKPDDHPLSEELVAQWKADGE